MTLESDVLRLLGDSRMQDIYEKACKEGYREVYRTRIMLVGHFGAGKTSVKRSLLNEEFVSQHVTTEGVETEETVKLYMTHVTENGEGAFRWKKVWCEISSRRTSHNTKAIYT